MNYVADEKSRRTVSVSVDTVMVIMFAGTVIGFVTAGAATLIDIIRSGSSLGKKDLYILR